jgi:hypothetical protein
VEVFVLKSSKVKSSYESPIMHFRLCKEQQHRQKQETDFGVAEAPPSFKPAGLTVCIFLSLSVHFVYSSGVFM